MAGDEGGHKRAVTISTVDAANEARRCQGPSPAEQEQGPMLGGPQEAQQPTGEQPSSRTLFPSTPRRPHHYLRVRRRIGAALGSDRLLPAGAWLLAATR